MASTQVQGCWDEVPKEIRCGDGAYVWERANFLLCDLEIAYLGEF